MHGAADECHGRKLIERVLPPSTPLCQAVALTSESDFRTLYRPGSALLVCPSCQGRMRLLAVVKNPVSIALLEEPSAPPTGAR